MLEKQRFYSRLNTRTKLAVTCISLLKTELQNATPASDHSLTIAFHTHKKALKSAQTDYLSLLGKVSKPQASNVVV